MRSFARARLRGVGHADPVRRGQRHAVAAVLRGGAASNQGLQRALGVPATLAVSTPGDASEREADLVADRVLRRPAGPASPPPAPVAAPLVQRACAECEEEEEGLVQRQAAGTQAPRRAPVDPIPDGGTSLSTSARAFFEPRFGRDFGRVRVHSGQRAAQFAAALQARAYTYGRDIVFGAGEYAPDTEPGRRLLAHELAHTIQQRRDSHLVQRLVRPNSVSCRNPSPALQATVGADPVATIDAANTRAVSLLDTAIDVLERNRAAVIGGATPAWPTIGDATAVALQARMRIDASNRAVWTGTGIGSVQLLIRRLRMVRNLLDGGGLAYTCIGPAAINTPGCAGAGCVADVHAVSCENFSRMFLCRPFWSDSPDRQAANLMHESFHIFFGFIDDVGHEGNAHCWEHLVFDLAGVAIDPAFVAGCPA